jgi:hypothetical protein
VTTATTGTSAAAIAAAAAQANASASAAFQAALQSSVVEARTIETTTLGSMVSGALKATRALAVSRPTTASTSAAGVTNSLSSAGSAGSTSSTSSTAGKYQIPEELKVYGNGKIPTEALEKIGIKGHKMWSKAAEAFKAMRAAAADAGVDIGVTDSYRPYEEQVDLVRRKGLYSQGGLAAKPGTSPHGWGVALDIDVTSEGLAWMREHGTEYGYVECVPREPWHWEYRP